MNGLSLYARERIASLYRSQARDLAALCAQADVTDGMSGEITNLAKLLQQEADVAWPRPSNDGTRTTSWTLQVEPEGPNGLIVLTSNTKGPGTARLWMRDATAVSRALASYAKHEIARAD